MLMSQEKWVFVRRHVTPEQVKYDSIRAELRVLELKRIELTEELRKLELDFALKLKLLIDSEKA